MTDEDRNRFGRASPGKDASGKFGLGVMEHSQSQKAQAEMVLMIFDMADRVLKRMIDNPVVVEGDSL